MIGDEDLSRLDAYFLRLVRRNNGLAKETDKDRMEELDKIGLTYLQLYKIRVLTEEYQKPNRGKWENNT